MSQELKRKVAAFARMLISEGRETTRNGGNFSGARVGSIITGYGESLLKLVEADRRK